MSIYGLIIGICLATSAWYFSKRNRIIPKNLEDLFIAGVIISSLFGARAYHVIDQWSYYSQHPNQIIASWNGGLGIYGGLLGGLLFILTFSSINKINPFQITDIISPILPLAQAFGRLGNYFNHENPVWWFEAVLNLFLFFILAKAPKHYNPTSLYLIGYGLIRFITEFSRTDTWVIGNIKIAHIISLVFIFCGFLLFVINYTKISKQKKFL